MIGTIRVVARAIVAVAMLVLGAGGPAHAQVQQRHVLGYYVPYDSTSWSAIEAHWSALSMLGAQWVTVDACGNLSSRDDQTLKRFAQVRGVQVLPSLLTLSGWLNHRLLTDEAVSEHLIEQIVGYTLAEDYAGFDLDLEAIEPSDREAFSEFVARLVCAHW
jgi:spore germination protein YaaH